MNSLVLALIAVCLVAEAWSRDIGHECMHGTGGTVQDCPGFIRCCKQKCPRMTNVVCSTKDGHIDKRTCECPGGSNTVLTSYPGTSGHSGSSSQRRTDTRYSNTRGATSGGSGSQCVRQAASCQHLKSCCQNTCGRSYSYSCDVLNGQVTSQSTCVCTGGQSGYVGSGSHVDSTRRSSGTNVYSAGNTGGTNTGNYGGTSRTRSSSGGYGSGTNYGSRTTGSGNQCVSRSRSCDQLKSCCKSTCGKGFSYSCETVNGQVTSQSYCSCSGSSSGHSGTGYVVEQPGSSHGQTNTRRTESSGDRYSGSRSNAGACVSEARTCNDLKTCCQNRCPYGFAYSCQTRNGRVTSQSTCNCKSGSGSGGTDYRVSSQGGGRGSGTSISNTGGSSRSGGHYTNRRTEVTSRGNPGSCPLSSRTCEDLKSCCQNQCIYGYSVRCQTSGGRVTSGSLCQCKSSSGQILGTSGHGTYGGETVVRTGGSHSSGSTGGGTYQGSATSNVNTSGCKRSSKNCNDYRSCCERICGNRVGRLSCKSMNGVFSEAVCQCHS